MKTPSSHPWHYAAAALLTVYLLLILFTYHDYGMSWDQMDHYSYGQQVLHFFTTHGKDKAAQDCYMRIYGTTFELASHFMERFLHPNHWNEARDLTSALFGLAGIYAALRIGWIAFGPAVGVTAALFLALTPVYYGHQFMNPKDIPFAAMILLSTWQILVLGVEYPAIRLRTVLGLALAIGLAMATRVGGLFVFGVLAGTLGVAVLMEWSQPRWKRRAAFLIVIGLGILLGSWAIMVALWPFARPAPYHNPMDTLRGFSHFSWLGKTFYGGHYMAPEDIPRTYLPNLILRTMPEFVLLGWAGLLLAAYRRTERFSRPALLGIVTLVLAAGLPIASVYKMHSPLFDSYRHLIFIIPPLVILAAVGAWRGARAFTSPAAKQIWVGVLAFFLLSTALDMRALHPYEYIYFNRLVAGGIEQANRSYELEYWATSMKEGCRWLRNNYSVPAGKKALYFAETAYLPEYYLDGTGRFQRTTKQDEAQILLILNRAHQGRSFPPGRVLYTVSRQGVPLLEVIEKDPAPKR